MMACVDGCECIGCDGEERNYGYLHVDAFDVNNGAVYDSLCGVTRTTLVSSCDGDGRMTSESRVATPTSDHVH